MRDWPLKRPLHVYYWSGGRWESRVLTMAGSYTFWVDAPTVRHPVRVSKVPRKELILTFSTDATDEDVHQAFNNAGVSSNVQPAGSPGQILDREIREALTQEILEDDDVET